MILGMAAEWKRVLSQYTRRGQKKLAGTGGAKVQLPWENMQKL